MRFDVQARNIFPRCVFFGCEVQTEYGLFFAGGCVSHLQHKVGFTEFFQVKVPREPYAKVKVKFVLNIEIEREFKVGTRCLQNAGNKFSDGEFALFQPKVNADFDVKRHGFDFGKPFVVGFVKVFKYVAVCRKTDLQSAKSNAEYQGVDTDAEFQKVRFFIRNFRIKFDKAVRFVEFQVNAVDVRNELQNRAQHVLAERNRHARRFVVSVNADFSDDVVDD